MTATKELDKLNKQIYDLQIDKAIRKVRYDTMLEIINSKRKLLSDLEEDRDNYLEELNKVEQNLKEAVHRRDEITSTIIENE